MSADPTLGVHSRTTSMNEREDTIVSERDDDHRPHPVHALARNYEWLHTGLGLVGNLAFLVGSVFFLSESLKIAGTWLFIVGAAGMLIGSIGRAIVNAHSDD